jgi:outer membrane cobalamin receptor
MYKLLLPLALCLFLCNQANQLRAQDLDSLLKLSAFSAESDLQKQLNQSSTVASGKALTTRETPGILSVITADDIQKMGARDIADILRTVPGFDIAQDVQFVTGVTFRGNWANEGKVLFMIDGHQINDLLYQTVPLLNNFPINGIEKIEIIRGPGSAIYGGSAEYAVVNITTKQASDLNGVAAYGTVSVHSSGVGRQNGGVMVAQKGKNFSWDLGAFSGKSFVSDQSNYSDPFIGNTPTDLKNTSKADPTHFNLGLHTKNISFRGMYNGYRTSDGVQFMSNDNYSADLKYEMKVSEKLTITPQLVYMNQVPWAYGAEIGNIDVLRARAVREMGNVVLNYNPGRKVNINGGALYFKDEATDLLNANYFGVDKYTLYNKAVFAQALLKHRLANVTFGARYETNNRAGDAFVPRLALTKKIENFHFKVLYSQAFRTPAIENQHLAYDVKVIPEKSSVAEIELGYQFTPEMLFSVNAYNMKTENTIIYIYIDNDHQYYKNYSLSGSSGIELVYSFRKNKWSADVNYSFAQANPNSTVDKYLVPQSNTQYAGVANQKLVMNLTYQLSEKLSVNATLINSGKRYAYTYPDVDGNPVATELPSYTLLNCFANYKNILKGLTFGLGVYDLLNEKPVIPQAYNGNYAPIPGRSREFVIKLSYQLNFKN